MDTKLSHQIAEHFKELFLDGNWICTNLKTTLKGIDHKKATKKIHSFNTIASLTFHIHYYVRAVLKVLRGGPLDAHDQYSFDMPLIATEEDWEGLLKDLWADVASFTHLVEALSEELLWENFAGEKYGNYFRNIQGLISHSYYHLGQIALLKKWISEHVKD